MKKIRITPANARTADFRPARLPPLAVTAPRLNDNIVDPGEDIRGIVHLFHLLFLFHSTLFRPYSPAFIPRHSGSIPLRRNHNDESDPRFRRQAVVFAFGKAG
jgi:hypothetical protein